MDKELLNKYLSTFKIVDVKDDVYIIEHLDSRTYKEYLSCTELLQFICEECYDYENNENSINLTCIVLHDLRDDLLKINIRELVSITNLFIRFYNIYYAKGVKLKEIYIYDILEGKFESYIFYINKSNIDYETVYKIFDGALYYVGSLYNKELQLRSINNANSKDVP